MKTLLDLPREIRDLIYAAVLDLELPLPSSPAECPHDRKQLSCHYGPDEYFGEHCNQYPTQSLPIASSGLLLTNRQVRTEILDVIARLKTHKQLRYKIDCMIEDEKRIYPTWLSIPAFSFHIDTVEVNFRIFGQRDGRCGFSHGCGGPSYLIWSLLALLDRFLERGPNFLSPLKTRQKIEVELITLNVVTAPEPAEGFIPEDWMLNDSATSGVIHPKAALDNIERELDGLLRRTYHTAAYAMTIYRGVRRMKLMLDGVTKKEWDLVAMEADRQQAMPSSASEMNESRMSNGGPVVGHHQISRFSRLLTIFCSCNKTSP